MDLLHGLFGYGVFIGLAWAMSEARRAVPWRTVAGGVLLQVALALLILKLPGAQAVFAALNDALLALEKATRAGTGMVFGYLGGGPLPFAEPFPGAAFVLAFQALPIVLVMSALSALLFHWRVLPLLVRGMSLLLERTLGVGGAVMEDGGDFGGFLARTEAAGIHDHARKARRQRQRAQARAFRRDAAVGIERAELVQQAPGFLQSRCRRRIEEGKLARIGHAPLREVEHQRGQVRGEDFRLGVCGQ